LHLPQLHLLPHLLLLHLPQPHLLLLHVLQPQLLLQLLLHFCLHFIFLYFTL